MMFVVSIMQKPVRKRCEKTRDYNILEPLRVVHGPEKAKSEEDGG